MGENLRLGDPWNGSGSNSWRYVHQAQTAPASLSVPHRLQLDGQQVSKEVLSSQGQCQRLSRRWTDFPHAYASAYGAIHEQQQQDTWPGETSISWMGLPFES